MMRMSPFLALMVASGLLHVAGAGGVLVYLAGNEVVVVEKTSLRVALGSSGAEAGQPVEVEPIEATEMPQQEARPEPKPAEKVLQPAESKPAVHPVEEVVAELPPKEIVEPAPEPVEVPAMVPGNAGHSGQSTDTDVETSDQDAEAGYQAILSSYDGLVLGHLAKFKTFPPAARMREEEGDVGVEFVIDRGGKLLDCRLLESSGSRRLDKAALRQLTDAVPYPAAPVHADWSTRTYKTKMRYRLN
ncbi:MAG: energy transducer TonB [Rhodobacterales bacterium]|nr:energy transducer TonB [Rhodobacterales bacterium]